MIPARVTIPIPFDIPKARGLEARNPLGKIERTRLSAHEQQAIQLAADAIGVTRSQFFRWCALWTAKEILEAEDVPFDFSRTDAGRAKLRD